MVTASFRFHEVLNDFLPPGRRGCEFSVPCARAASVKHMIEALGVPHTEVGLVLVNGGPAGLDRLLAEGDRVSVHPGLAQAPDAAWEPRFIADSHLGGLARMLRMAGFDTLYRNDYDDREIVALAAAEARLILSRDRELLKMRDVARGCYVHAVKPAQQFREVVARYSCPGGCDLAAALRPFTRCLECNRPLREVAKAEVLDRLPPSVRLLHEHFTRCDACGRVYWRGSHWRRMRTLVDESLGCGAQRRHSTT